MTDIKQSDLDSMRAYMKEYDDLRDEVINQSRQVIKLSKRVIYSVHQDDLEKAEDIIEDVEEEKEKLIGIAEDDYLLRSEGIYKTGFQEYAEALLYFYIVKEDRLVTREELDIKPTFYILGLCDLTGELVRRATYLAGKDRYDQVVEIRDFVDRIYGELLKFEFPRGETRKKFDSIKYDLKKLEDLVLQMKMKHEGFSDGERESR